jgi:hypothetical protein
MPTDAKTSGVLFCIFILVLALVNFAIMWARAAGDIRKNPQKKKGYVTLLGWASLIYVPFLFAGLTLATGFAGSPGEFFRSDKPGSAVVAFHVVMASAVLIMLVFVWFLGGLRLMLTHPAMFHLPWSEVWMKMFWGVLSIFAVVVFGQMLLSDFREVLK